MYAEDDAKRWSILKASPLYVANKYVGLLVKKQECKGEGRYNYYLTANC